MSINGERVSEAGRKAVLLECQVPREGGYEPGGST